MPEFLNNTDVLRGIVYTLCFVVFLLFLLFVVARVRNTELPARPPLRKVALYVAFLLFGVVFLFGENLSHAIADRVYGVHDVVLPEPSAATRAMAAMGDEKAQQLLLHWKEINASTQQIAADEKVGGWVPVGTATSKIVLVISFYLLGYILPWLVQMVTHPAPTDWVKSDYKTQFKELTDLEKFRLIGRLSLNQSIRFAASVLAACLIQ